MKRILVTGSTGLLGGHVVSALRKQYLVFGLSNSRSHPYLENNYRVDLTNRDHIQDLIESIKPDCVVHCGAITHVDFCEQEREMAFATNALGTKNLVDSLDPKVRMMYISTDSIFDGNKNYYCETDEPSPLNVYAKTKLDGEKFVKERLTNHAIVRTNMFGWNLIGGESFAEWIINSLKAGNPIRMFNDVIFSPVFVGTLVNAIKELISSEFRGVLNVGSTPRISKYQFGIKLAKYFSLNPALIQSISVDEFAFKAKRPKRTSLNLDKQLGLFGKLPELSDEIATFYQQRRGAYETVHWNR